MKKYVEKIFFPQADITIAELAVIIAETTAMGMRGVCFTDEQWKELPKNIKRHFVGKEK